MARGKAPLRSAALAALALVSLAEGPSLLLATWRLWLPGPAWDPSTVAPPRPPLRPQGPSAAAPPRPAQQQLLEATLPELELAALREDLAAEVWTEESLLVKVLLRQGAQDVVTQPWAGQSRSMSLKLPLGIPWGKIRRYLGSVDDLLEEPTGASSVEAVHRVVPTEGLVVVDSAYEVPMLSLSLHLRVALQQQHRQGVKYTFSGWVEFENASTGLFSNRFVQRCMEMGFMEAAKRYGQAVLAELQAPGRR